MTEPYVLITIFLITYILVAVQKFPCIHIDRPSGVLVGSTLLIATGFISMQEAYSFIDMDVLTFLLGMMIVIGYLELSGFFGWSARWMVHHARSPRGLLAWIIPFSGIMSALFVNDTVCLLFTPVVLHASRLMRVNPVPFLIAVGTASNIGSALAVTGNPQNMYIGIKSGIPFLTFMAEMALPVAVSLFINWLVIRLFYPLSNEKVELPDEKAGVNRRLLLVSLGSLGLTLLLFILGASYPFAALAGGCLAIVTARVQPRQVFARVDWAVLLFFAGLFVVMGAFRKAGYMDGFSQFMLTHITGTDVGSVTVLSGATLLLSNLVSNVPAVILLEPVVRELGGGNTLWLLLALTSTYAGNLTLIGSVANLIVAEKAEREGVHISFWEFMKSGVIITFISMFFGVLFLLYF